MFIYTPSYTVLMVNRLNYVNNITQIMHNTATDKENRCINILLICSVLECFQNVFVYIRTGSSMVSNTLCKFFVC